MQTVNIRKAKAHLFELIEAVALGETVVITIAGKQAAMLLPPQGYKAIRKPGAMKGKIRIAEDFDEHLPCDLQAGFESR